jgi:broad specificity phosphatase PhoE
MTFKIIFIRHGEKKYNNNKGIPIYDPPLKDNIVMPEINNIDEIISSPYLRCRQTAVMYGNNITINSDIGEFLGNQSIPITANTVDSETFKYELPPIKETINQLHVRVEKFLNELYEMREHKTILCVTHGIIIASIITLVNKKIWEISIDNGLFTICS